MGPDSKPDLLTCTSSFSPELHHQSSQVPHSRVNIQAHAHISTCSSQASPALSSADMPNTCAAALSLSWACSHLLFALDRQYLSCRADPEARGEEAEVHVSRYSGARAACAHTPPAGDRWQRLWRLLGRHMICQDHCTLSSHNSSLLGATGMLVVSLVCLPPASSSSALWAYGLDELCELVSARLAKLTVCEVVCTVLV